MLFGVAKYKEIFLRKEYESGFIMFNNAIPWIVVSTWKGVVNWINKLQRKELSINTRLTSGFRCRGAMH
jgi:hypothetical protein